MEVSAGELHHQLDHPCQFPHPVSGSWHSLNLWPLALFPDCYLSWLPVFWEGRCTGSEPNNFAGLLQKKCPFALSCLVRSLQALGPILEVCKALEEEQMAGRDHRPQKTAGQNEAEWGRINQADQEGATDLGKPSSKKEFWQLGGPCHTDWGWGYVPILHVADATVTDHCRVRIQTPLFLSCVSSCLGLFFCWSLLDQLLYLITHYIWSFSTFGPTCTEVLSFILLFKMNITLVMQCLKWLV